MFQLWASKAAEEKATRLKRSAVTSFVSIKIDTRKRGAGQIDFCQAYVEHILLYCTSSCCCCFSSQLIALHLP